MQLLMDIYRSESVGYEIAISTDPNVDPDTCTFLFEQVTPIVFTLPVEHCHPVQLLCILFRTVCTASDTSIGTILLLPSNGSKSASVRLCCDFEDLTENSNLAVCEQNQPMDY
jgi:hypothetical protein